MKDNLTKERAVCLRCKRKRFIDEMTLIFKHPLIHPKGIYACTDKHWKYGECLQAVQREILMYANTGLIHVQKAV